MADNIIQEWLRSLNLVHYTQAFVDNGYDDLEICKQIGNPDLDAIGVEKESHRKDILQAVQILREKGGTHVYFILENPDYKEQNGMYSDSNFFDRELPPIPTEDGVGEVEKEEQVVPSNYYSSPSHQQLNNESNEEGYAAGRAAFVTYPKLQLTSIIRDKLHAQDIDLLKEPYTKEEEDCPYDKDSPTGHYTMYSIYGQSNRSVPPPLPACPPPSTMYADPADLSDSKSPKHTSSATSTEDIQQQVADEDSTSQDSGAVDRGGMGLGTSTITRFLKGVAARRSARKYTYKKPHEGDLNASDITMSDDDRIQLMIMVKEGKLSMHEAVEAVKHYERHRPASDTQSSQGSPGGQGSPGQQYRPSSRRSSRTPHRSGGGGGSGTRSKSAPLSVFKRHSPRQRKQDPTAAILHDIDLSDPSSIEYTPEELRVHASSSHSSPCASIHHSPELTRHHSVESPLASHQHRASPRAYLSSPVKHPPPINGQATKDKKFGIFSSPFTRRKTEAKDVSSPLSFRKGSDTGSTSSGGVQSPGSRSAGSRTHSPAADGEFLFVRHSPSAELHGSRRSDNNGAVLERGGSSPSLSRSTGVSVPSRRGSETVYTQRSVTFSSFKRSPSHDPSLRKQSQEPPYRIHRAITQPISENYDYAYVCHIDRTIGTTTAVIETRPSDNLPKRSRSTGTDIHPPVSSILDITDAQDDSRSPKRHTPPPSNSPPEAQSPKRRQYISSDQSKATTQIIIEDRCSPQQAKKDGESATTKTGLEGVETSPTGTLDSVDLKESKFGSSSTMSVGSEASPTTERNRKVTNKRTPAEKVAQFSRPRSNSFTTGDECLSSDFDDEEMENEQRSDEYFVRNSSSRSSLSDKVKVIRRDMKKKISRLRSSGGSGEESAGQENKGSMESIQSATAVFQPVSSSSSSSMSVDELQEPVYKGPILAKARVKSDYTPSPYDKDALALKRGEIISIISMSETGMWKGFINNRIGHFKFIHVEVLADESNRLTTLPRKPKKDRRVSRRARPKTVDELLGRLGLQPLLPLFLMHGYDTLKLFSELEEEDLNELQVINPEERAKILTAAQLLCDYDDTPDESPFHDASLSPSTPCDSPHHATTVSKDSGCSSGESTLKQDKNKDTPDKEWVSSSLPPEAIMSTSDNGSTLTKISEKKSDSEKTTDFSQEDQEIISVMANGEIKIERGDGTCYITPGKDEGEGRKGEEEDEGEKEEEAESSSSNKGVKLSNGRHLCDKHRRELSARTHHPQSVIDRKSVQTQVQSSGQMMRRSHSLKEASPPVPSRNRPKIPNRTTSLTPGTSPSHEGSEQRTVSTQHSMVQSFHQQQHHRRRSGSPQTTPEHLINALASSPKIKTATVRQLSSSPNRMATMMGVSLPSQQLSPSRRVSGVSPERRQRNSAESPDRGGSPRTGGGLHTHRRPRPTSVTLESLLISKLQDDQIDLSAQPYTDKAGFCGIPPALVLRYAEELRREVHDVAHSLDETRIKLLQAKKRPWVPNDFLWSACQAPIQANVSSIPEFFLSLGLPMYSPVFLRHGFTSVRTLQTLHEGDLRGLGVNNPRHVKRIADTIVVMLEMERKGGGGGAKQVGSGVVGGGGGGVPGKVTDKV